MIADKQTLSLVKSLVKPARPAKVTKLIDRLEHGEEAKTLVLDARELNASEAIVFLDTMRVLGRTTPDVLRDELLVQIQIHLHI